MKIVINVDDKRYDLLKRVCGTDRYEPDEWEYAIINGTPLPKGHGRIGDLDKIKKEMQDYHDDCAKTSEYTRLEFETAVAVVEDAPTIIEAERAENEGKE